MTMMMTMMKMKGMKDFNPMMTEREIKERIYDLKKEIDIYEKILKTTHEFGRPTGSTKFTPAQLEFLKLCVARKLPIPKITDLFNKRYKTNYPLESRGLYNAMLRQGIIKTTYTRIGKKIIEEKEEE